jgi:transposase
MVSDKEEFQERCQEERRRLGVGGVSSAVADGAKWIWNVVGEVFGKTEKCLDIFHALEHVAKCGKELYGETELAKA